MVASRSSCALRVIPVIVLKLHQNNKFKDLSKYNNKVRLGKDGLDKDATEEEFGYFWTENVKFPAEGLVIES